jgi:sugar/nucleoside kinase (ribokinase family)
VSVTVCLGQPVVELVPEGAAFVPRLGGTAAQVAVTAARTGARVVLAGAAADDRWGRWLRDELDARGVPGLVLLDGPQTPVVFVGDTVDRYGDAIALSGVDFDQAAGIVLTGESLVDERQRRLTMDVRARALELDRPMLFEAALQGSGWRSRADAAASANACVPGALLVWAAEPDAALMTGETDPERAALAMVKAGARLVLIDLGEEGAILRGELRRDVYGSSVAFGELVGRLAQSDFYPPVAAAALA